MSSITQKSALNVVMGSMTFGEEGQDGARIHDLKEVKDILEVFRSHGHTEIDSARVYSGGTSEEYLGQLAEYLKENGFKIETKLYPTKAKGDQDGISHTPESLRKHLLRSLDALKLTTLDIWYLHGPDRTVPYEVTLKAVNELYHEGYFKQFGISNYAAWEVAEMVGICKANGYIQPTVYQGVYHALHRAVEPELFPCLQKFGISFYEFSPLGGGLFTGRYNSLDDKPEPGSRYDPDRVQGKSYRSRYWKEPHFQALKTISNLAEKHNLTLAEIALRWVSHHSLLRREHGDAILIGASRLSHIKQNLLDLEKGPLPAEVVSALDEAWLTVEPYSIRYFH
ncbi:Aldo/keto reductase [Crucibulum laeve]|uniref:Aldo/keto reductase n=1 Tax=Crucibulum laeve TaxID=68775 RepID=A0A5C3LHQ3_9AGAR|nr:Aldo/keto reductase [Crucibulum laeve]